ncbi:hypothetical protein ACF0H5_016292 [Mactra antiquata]
MKIHATYICLILSFGVLVNSEEASTQKDRDKRSPHLQNALKKMSKLRNKPFWRNVRRAATKRSGFDTLDLDELFNDPLFLDLSNTMPDYSFDDGAIDMNSLTENLGFPLVNGLPDIPDKVEAEEIQEDMSNVIPGARNPFGKLERQNEIFDITRPYHHDDLQAQLFGGGSMINELLELLEMKERGLLDACLPRYKKRR